MYDEVFEELLKWQPWEYPFTSSDMFKRNIYGIRPAGMPKRSRKPIKKEFIIIDGPEKESLPNVTIISNNIILFFVDFTRIE